jgi:hypothetical protein
VGAASLNERDPEVIPDVDIAAKVGKDLFLDEKIQRHESGQGYVRVVKHSVLWKEKEASKFFTYQGLTTCTEVDRSWTIMSNTWMMAFICSCRNKIGAELHIYTLRKVRTIRGCLEGLYETREGRMSIVFQCSFERK